MKCQSEVNKLKPLKANVNIVLIIMNVGEVRKAEEKDFQILKSHLACSDEEWTLEYEKKDIKVWTKLPPKEQNTNFKLIKVGKTIV